MAIMTQIAIEVRPARMSDAAALAALHDEAWRLAYRGIIPALTLERMLARRGGGRWRRRVRLAQDRLLVLSFDTTIAGYASIGPARAEIAGCSGEISELYFKPEYQGVGLGSILLKAARQRLTMRGHAGQFAWALAENQLACAFYEARGGIAKARIGEQLGDKILQKIAYCWPRGAA